MKPVEPQSLSLVWIYLLWLPVPKNESELASDSTHGLLSFFLIVYGTCSGNTSNFLNSGIFTLLHSSDYRGDNIDWFLDP